MPLDLGAILTTLGGILTALALIPTALLIAWGWLGITFDDEYREAAARHDEDEDR